MGGATFLHRLTTTRIVLVPVVMALVLADDGEGGTTAVVAASVFAIAACTDFVDGYLARRWQVATKLGSFLDTTADKLLVTGALIALVAVDRASAWIAALIIARELVILALRGAVASEGRHLEPSFWGKAKTNVQFLAILLAIMRFDDTLGPLYLDEWVMIAAAVITVLSAIEYFSRFGSALTSSDA